MPKARKGASRKRPYGKYLKGIIDEQMALGTLAALTLVAQPIDEVVDKKTLISSVKLVWSLKEFTPVAGAGPILIGVAHSDYTAAEIEEVIENANSWNEGDLVAQEVAKRKIRIIGSFYGAAQDLGGVVMNDGKPITTKLNWMLQEGQTLDVWAYNTGTAALSTTDPKVRAYGHANLWSRG